MIIKYIAPSVPLKIEIGFLYNQSISRYINKLCILFTGFCTY